MKLSRIDLQVLDIVSRDARITIKDMAEECGASLMAAGAIASSGFQINPKILGYGTCTYVGIHIQRGATLREVIEDLKMIDEIVECHITTGSYALLIKLYAKDNTDLLRILNQSIQSIEGVAGTETLISLEMAFDRNIRIPSHNKRKEHK